MDGAIWQLIPDGVKEGGQPEVSVSFGIGGMLGANCPMDEVSAPIFVVKTGIHPFMPAEPHDLVGKRVQVEVSVMDYGVMAARNSQLMGGESTHPLEKAQGKPKAWRRSHGRGTHGLEEPFHLLLFSHLGIWGGQLLQLGRRKE